MKHVSVAEVDCQIPVGVSGWDVEEMNFLTVNIQGAGVRQG